MVKAKWMKNHEELMAEEVKKNKLLAENELLEKQKRELVATIKELRDEVSKHAGDYETITKERIDVVNGLDERLAELKTKQEQLEEKKKEVSQKANNLQSSARKLEEDILQKEEDKKNLETEIEGLKVLSKTLRLSKEGYENERRVELKKILDELSEAKHDLAEARKESKERQEEIQRETRLLSIRRSDLEIYEQRMLKKYPNEKFILK